MIPRYMTLLEQDITSLELAVETLYRISKALDVSIDELVKKETQEKIVN